MAHTINITTVNDGPKNVVVHVYLKCDGVTGEIVDQIIVDPALLVPSRSAKPFLSLDEIWWDFTGFGVRFEYNSIPDTPVWTASAGNGSHVCFEDFGGLADRSGLDGAGALRITTFGFDNAAKEGTFVVKLTK